MQRKKTLTKKQEDAEMVLPTTTTRRRSRSGNIGSSYSLSKWWLVVIVGLFAQLLGNVIWYRHLTIKAQERDYDNLQTLRKLSVEFNLLEEKAAAATTTTWNDEFLLFFTIRDALRLAPTQIPSGVHIFDYMGGNATSKPEISAKLNQVLQKQGVHLVEREEAHEVQELYYDAHHVDTAACSVYSVECYREKIGQTFEYLLETQTNVSYFFYMEMDNDLCVSLDYIRNFTRAYHPKYFLSTGIGFSGWIMSRQFMQDFLDVYAPTRQQSWLYNATTTNHSSSHTPTNLSQVQQLLRHRESSGVLDFKWNPDVVASLMLIEKQAWAVTRRYFVSHTILPGVGAGALTLSDQAGGGESTPTPPEQRGKGRAKMHEKHLPRCLEPRRALWPISETNRRDRFGWDFFDHDLCPDSEIFPCQPGQLPLEVIFDTETIAADEKAQANKTDIRKSNMTFVHTIDKLPRPGETNRIHSQRDILGNLRHGSVEEALEGKGSTTGSRLFSSRNTTIHSARLSDGRVRVSRVQLE